MALSLCTLTQCLDHYEGAEYAAFSFSNSPLLFEHCALNVNTLRSLMHLKFYVLSTEVYDLEHRDRVAVSPIFGV